MAHSIRPVTAADGRFLVEMLCEALFVPPGEPPFPREIVDRPGLSRYVRDFGERAGDRGFIAEGPAGDPIGAAWVRQFTASAPGYAFVDESTPELSIAVSPDHRGRGVGTALLVELLKGLNRCCLSVDDRNPAVRLYERFGFRAVSHADSSLTMLLSKGSGNERIAGMARR